MGAIILTAYRFTCDRHPGNTSYRLDQIIMAEDIEEARWKVQQYGWMIREREVDGFPATRLPLTLEAVCNACLADEEREAGETEWTDNVDGTVFDPETKPHHEVDRDRRGLQVGGNRD